MIAYTTEAGTELTAPSEEALEKGWDWYNAKSTTKAEMIEFCAAHGISLMEKTDDPYFKTGEKLVEDWAEIAAYTYATHGPNA